MKRLFILILFFANLTAWGQEKKPDATMVRIMTDYGNIDIKLYDDTPLHRDNFIKLIRSGYYNDQIFHRVINNFMIQGGDLNSKNASRGEMLGQGGSGYTIPAEIRSEHYHKKGALAAARKGDSVNPEKASSGSQFYIIQGTVLSPEQLNFLIANGYHQPFTQEQIKDYITIGGSPHLDGEYTVFGEVVDGLDILDKIASVKTDDYDRPIVDIPFKIIILQ